MAGTTNKTTTTKTPAKKTEVAEVKVPKKLLDRELQQQASAEFNKRLLAFLEAVRVTDNGDKFDVNVLNIRYSNYLKQVATYDMRISNQTLYGALGFTKDLVADCITGRRKCPTDVRDFLIRAKQECSMYREASVMQGEMNTVLYIFQAKNFDGMSDTQEVMIQTDTGGGKSDAELKKKYLDRQYSKEAEEVKLIEKDKVIDAEVIESRVGALRGVQHQKRKED